jgi:hypothetical protein
LEEYSEDDLGKIEIFYRHPGVTTSTIITNDGTILKPKYNPTFIPSVSFTLEKDRWGNYKLFNIERVRGKHILYATKVQEGGLITDNSNYLAHNTLYLKMQKPYSLLYNILKIII